MNTSNAAVQTSKAEAQKGFSLIELLVVVAIIGVLAAAGIVGYQSYLDGVKKDTQGNNAQAVAKAMQLAVTAANSDLTGNVPACKSSTISDATNAKTCITSMLANELDKWKSPFGDNAKKGSAYFDTSASCVAETIQITYTAAVVGPPAVPAKVTLTACDKTASALQKGSPLADVSFDVTL